MKHHCKTFGRNTKISSNSKDRLPNYDKKFEDRKSKLSGCSEHESDQNGDASGNRGFSSVKLHHASFRKQAQASVSCFSKVNLLAQGQSSSYTGARMHGKENSQLNIGSDSQGSNLGDLEPTSLEANDPQPSIEARIQRFLRNLQKKYSQYIKGDDKKIEEQREDIQKFEGFVRGLEGQALEDFLTSCEAKYAEEQKDCQNTNPVRQEEPEDDAEMDCKSEGSEILQEEIIMMTNLQSTFPTQASLDQEKRDFEEQSKFRLDQEQLVPIDMKLNVNSLVIKDQFLWEASCNDRGIMRQFALQLLSEKLGRTGYSILSGDIKRRFAEAVAEIIQYNLNLYNKIDMKKLVESLNEKNKQLQTDGKEDSVKGQSSSICHPIVKVNIRLHRENGELIEDSLYWDLTCDLNNPEQFANEYCRDLSLGNKHEKQVSFAIRKQVFDHLKQVSLTKKYNLLKSLGIPVNKEMVMGVSKSMSKSKEMNGENSEISDNEMYIPQDFFSSYNNMDDDKPSGHKSNSYGYYGNRRFVGKDKSKKSMAPKDITLIVRKIIPDSISEEDGDQEKLEAAVQYCCELLLVGNRRTRIVQRKQKVKNNRRICLKRTVVKRTPETGFTNTRKESEDNKSEKSSDDAPVVQEVVSQAEDDSDEESEPHLVTGIVGEIESSNSERESSTHKEDGSDNNTTSYV